MPITGPEGIIFNIADQHRGKPWFGMHPHSVEHLTYRTQVPTLNSADWDTITSRESSLSGLKTHRKAIREANERLWRSSDVLTMVLDGRANIYNQGYLGDLVEATRIINPILASGRNLRIITSAPDVFSGFEGSNLEITGIPAHVPVATDLPWQPELLRYVGQQADSSPVLFPLNARVPMLFDINGQGEVRNLSAVSELNRFLNQSQRQFGIRYEKWAKKGMHQLQALQVMTDLIGLDGSFDWSQFPDAFLHPDGHAKDTAAKVVNLYHCFYKSNGRPPLLLHPGVATDGMKLKLKSYPESRWKRVITGISDEGLPVKSLTIIRPTDATQNAVAVRLVNHARKLGLKVSDVPEAKVRQDLGWSVGSFIAFLQELAHRQGVIVGCDSLPAGHAGPAVGIRSVVLGSPFFNPTFFCPPENSMVVMPNANLDSVVDKDITTGAINPTHVVEAIRDII